MKLLVNHQRIVEIDGVAEKDLLPEVGDDRKVLFEVQVPEMVPDLRVVYGYLVEFVEQAFNVCPRFDIGLHYSVETSSSPCKAALRVCQLKEAHFTRAGNSSTPANIFSFPRWFSSFSTSKPPVTIRWNSSNIASASSFVFP